MDFVNSLTRSNNGKTFGIAAVVATGLAAAYYFFGSTSSQDSDLLPALDEDQAYEVLKKIFDKLRMASEKLMGHLSNIQQQIQAQGMDMPAEQVVKMYIFPHFEMAFKEIQADVLAEAEVDEEELEDAVNTYVKNGDARLTELSEKLKMLYAAMGGDVAKGKSEAAGGEDDFGGEETEMSVDAVVHVLGRLGHHMSVEMDAYCKSFIEQNGVPTNQYEFQEFQQGIVPVSDNAERKAREESGVSSIQLQKSLMKHAENRKVQEVIQQLQMTNMQVMYNNGINIAQQQ